MRTVIILSVLIVLAVWRVPAAAACSCVVPPAPREALEQADAVFVGTVLKIDVVPGAHGEEHHVRFAIDHHLKGPKSLELVVHTASNSAACGYYFRPGRQYIVYAHKGEGGYHTGLCTRTARFQDAAEDRAAFKLPADIPSRGKVDDGSDVVGATGGICGGRGNTAALQGAFFVLLGLLLGRRCRC